MATYLYHKIPCHSLNELYEAFMVVHPKFKYIKSIYTFKRFYNKVGLDNLDKQANIYPNMVQHYYIYKDTMYTSKTLFKYNNYLNKLSYEEYKIVIQYLYRKTKGKSGQDITDLIDNNLIEYINHIYKFRKHRQKIEQQAQYIYEYQNKNHKLELKYIKQKLYTGWTPNEILDNSRKFWKHRYSTLKRYEYNGKEYTFDELYEFVNKINPMPKTAFNWRMGTHWPIAKIINIPVKEYASHIEPIKPFKYVYKGKTYTKRKELYDVLTEEKIISMSIGSFNKKIKQGWSIEKIIANPIRRRSLNKNILYDYQGKKYNFNELFKLINEQYYPIKETSLRWRLNNNWSVEKIINTPIN